MSISSPIAVIGGTGKSGKYLVLRLLAQQLSIKVLVRNLDHFTLVNPLVEAVVGDVVDYDAVYRLVSGCSAVVSTLGLGVPPSEPTIFTQSTAHVLEAMHAHGIRRYIVTTGLNVDTPFDRKGATAAAATAWMKQTYPASTINKQQEYDLLRASTVDWTMVRLPLIVQTDEAPPVRVSLEDCPGKEISATSLADFLIGQLASREFVSKAPFVANE
ncbi:NAD(P)H-binding protein [Paraflavitalea sp. CAU 1676]|uniref:NAD(P)-dependent oxidoreductase n=1 Tax=Paraflavitalea sp. CAU 1676 TaxID=3032598 RepID=UPI0023DC3981|nr:NAD(P)H-binding protein [Paraflavitalea sp. CAU 1676]MDF2187999.1 NAD(P)H-binding protein [Paraflavitalea sp. CAU 1676]